MTKKKAVKKPQIEDIKEVKEKASAKEKFLKKAKIDTVGTEFNVRLFYLNRAQNKNEEKFQKFQTLNEAIEAVQTFLQGE